MGFIPKGARWYLADVVLEHVIEGDRRNVVHVNTHLIEAASPEEAYRKARTLGHKSQFSYLNTDHRRVRVKFRGLRELAVLLDDPEDGVEISYEETVGVPESKLRQWGRAKPDLAVFAPCRPRRGGPNYMPLTVMKKLEAAGFTRADVEGPPVKARRTLSAPLKRQRPQQTVGAKRRSSRPRAR
jgi:hypothetical protein